MLYFHRMKQYQFEIPSISAMNSNLQFYERIRLEMQLTADDILALLCWHDAQLSDIQNWAALSAPKTERRNMGTPENLRNLNGIWRLKV